MKYLLVKLNYYYADEFDVDSMWITTESEHEQFLQNLKDHKDRINDATEIHFGTNEFVSFSSFEELVRSMKVVEITPEFYNDFMTFIGYDYGLISPDTILERYCSEKEW